MKPWMELARRRSGALAAWSLFGLVAAALPACAGDKPAAPAGGAASPEVVAEVNGQPITLAEVEAAAASQIAQLERQKRQFVEQTLDRVVADKLVELEAKARGVAPEALVASEVQSKIGEISDDEVTIWYEQNRARLGNRPKETIAGQIKQFLGQQQAAAVRDTFLAGLRAKYPTKILLEPARIEVAEADSPAKGPVGAPITIVEFSDFECPFCGRVNPSIQQARETYGDKLRVVFRQFPLNSIHPRAAKAAEASLCANAQGKFWEMHDAMFADQKKIDIADLKAKAGSLGLDQAKFDACLDSNTFAAKVNADLADGQKVGVTGTPALFVNGIAFSGAVPFEDLAKAIDRELERKGIANPRAAATK